MHRGKILFFYPFHQNFSWWITPEKDLFGWTFPADHCILFSVLKTVTKKQK
jgi:hypothetical protein